MSLCGNKWRKASSSGPMTTSTQCSVQLKKGTSKQPCQEVQSSGQMSAASSRHDSRACSERKHLRNKCSRPENSSTEFRDYQRFKRRNAQNSRSSCCPSLLKKARKKTAKRNQTGSKPANSIVESSARPTSDHPYLLLALPPLSHSPSRLKRGKEQQFSRSLNTQSRREKCQPTSSSSLRILNRRR